MFGDNPPAKTTGHWPRNRGWASSLHRPGELPHPVWKLDRLGRNAQHVPLGCRSHRLGYWCRWPAGRDIHAGAIRAVAHHAGSHHPAHVGEGDVDDRTGQCGRRTRGWRRWGITKEGLRGPIRGPTAAASAIVEATPSTRAAKVMISISRSRCAVIVVTGARAASSYAADTRRRRSHLGRSVRPTPLLPPERNWDWPGSGGCPQSDNG